MEKKEEEAKLKFKDMPHVTIIHGDSEEILAPLIPEFKSRTIFWLDGQ